MLVRRIISLLLFIWIIGWVIYLVDHYYYMYVQNKQLVKEVKTLWTKNQQLQENMYQSQIDNIMLWLPTLEDVMKTSEKKKKYLTTLSAQEQLIKSDLSTTLQLTTAEKIKLLKERRERSQEEQDVIGKKITLQIPDLELDVETLPVTLWDIKDTTQITDQNIYDTIDTLLEQGPVRFPGTDIIDNWITTIYGHSSQTKNIKNYSYFRHLPYTSIDQQIILKSERKQYKYKIVESKQIEIVDVNILKQTYLEQYPDKKFLFLVTCFPLNSSDQRWVVVAEQRESTYINK